MFLVALVLSISLFVYLLATLFRKLWTDCDEILLSGLSFFHLLRFYKTSNLTVGF